MFDKLHQYLIMIIGTDDQNLRGLWGHGVGGDDDDDDDDDDDYFQ